MPDPRNDVVIDRMAMPFIHSNGKSRNAHIEERSNAINALAYAASLHRALYPHMRDYYPLSDGEARFGAACAIHQAREAEIEILIAALQAEVEILVAEDYRG